MDLNLDGWGDFGEIPDDIILREDKEAIAREQLRELRKRCPVKTGKLRDSLLYRVLKRSVKWGSDVPYYRRHQWRFAFILPQDDKRMDQQVEKSADRFFRLIDIERRRR